MILNESNNNTSAFAQGSVQRSTQATLNDREPIGYRVHSSAWPIPYRLTESAPHYEDHDQRAREAGL